MTRGVQADELTRRLQSTRFGASFLSKHMVAGGMAGESSTTHVASMFRVASLSATTM